MVNRFILSVTRIHGLIAIGTLFASTQRIAIPLALELEKRPMSETIKASQISELLETAGTTFEVLSLDCFDTLIWRNVHRPTDVFCDLDIPDCTMEMRVLAEKRARNAIAVQMDRQEVTINEIYQHLFDEADDKKIAFCIEKELLAEARQCFAFQPVVELIAAAKARGMKVVIVSDTYLEESMLKRLIADAAGQEVMDQIDRIFCSCDYGLNKASGLFRHVLDDLKIEANKLLHLGDNKVADHDAPLKLGINGVHFEQFDDEAQERLRLETVAATVLEHSVRKTIPAIQPHRPQISLRTGDSALFQFGHDVLGPIYHGFSNWIADQAKDIERKTGKKPKLLFLMRDGFLPARAFLSAYPEFDSQVAMVEISRFTANASSFANQKAIKDYLIAEVAGSPADSYTKQRQAAFCRQLLFKNHELKKIANENTVDAFVKKVLQPQNLQKIISRSNKFRKGLVSHLQKNGVEHGDAVMFVDLGYNGSVQNALETVLSNELKLSIHGRYLLLRELMVSGLDKKGLIDKRNYDIKALHALCESIAVLEQLSTQSKGSVLGYTGSGEPKRDSLDIKGAQSEARDTAQEACLAYIEKIGTGWSQAPKSLNSCAFRMMAAGALTRLLFFPVDREVSIFENFNHDVNLGTKDIVQFFDPKNAAKGLRRRGLFYSKNISRMYLPGELKQSGMQALLPLFVSTRFGLDVRQDDFHAGGIDIPVILADERENVKIDVKAYPTNDGYYQALIPCGLGELSIAIMIGQVCDWFQVEEVSFYPVDQFMAKKIDDDAIVADPIFDSISENGPGLHRCVKQSAFIMLPSTSVKSSDAMMLSFVFRPTVRRDSSGILRKVA